MERNSKKLIKRLVNEGWELVSVKGSHHKYRRSGLTVIIPRPKKDLPAKKDIPIGTARAIGKMAGWL